MEEQKVQQQLASHTVQLGLMTKEVKDFRGEFDEFRNEVLTGQDQMIKILMRLDQERIFTHEWVKRIETEVAHHTEDINRIKLQLQIA